MGFVKPITGPGITDKVGMVSADLGIARWDAQRGCNAVMFGDNFSERYLRGDWQSPSIVCYDDDYTVLGIPTLTGIASEGRRRQLWDYPHNNDEYSTILPCDFIKVNNIWYVAAMVTAGLGNELRTVFWQSRNLVEWQKTDPYVTLQHPGGHPGDVMLTFDQIGDWVYTFGTNGLARDRGVWMWRMLASEFPTGWFEPWGCDDGQWGWSIPNENTPLLEGKYGELCFRYIQGNCVLSFFDADAYRQSALTVVAPTDDWAAANRCDYAHGQDFPQLYGGYITPGSRLNEPNGMEFLVSQWNTASNDPYHVCLFTDTLAAQGPLIEPKPEPKPVPEPTPPKEGGAMTPQQLYELLIKELSASGSVPITTPDGAQITLRQAVAQIYEKERGMLHMAQGRPRHPRETDDQFGHVLNARAEGLFNQALLVALADQAGIDVGKLYDDVQRSLQ